VKESIFEMQQKREIQLTREPPPFVYIMILQQLQFMNKDEFEFSQLWDTTLSH
jgi:hypothetical protein